MQPSSPRLLVEPAYANFPAYAETFGPEVADLCDLAGFGPDPEQELALDALFGIDRDGRSVCFDFATICARQNMKTGFQKQAALGWLYVTQQRLITWSAHEMTPTKEAFSDLVNLIENCAPLAKRLEDGPTNGVFRGSGQQAIALRSSKECPDGQRIIFKARTHGGGRGLTGNKVILDEGFALENTHMGSLMPTLSAVPDPQILIGSSACLSKSDVLRRIVERGRSVNVEPRKRLGYLEYCAPEDACETYPDCLHWPGTPGCAMDNREYIQLANPQAGRRITWDYLEGERAALDPAEFGRERMGWHDKPDVGDLPLISKDLWTSRIDAESTPVDPVSFGIYVNRMQTNAAIGVAAYRADGKVHVGIIPAVKGEPLDTLPGVGWIPGRVKELVDQWKPCATVVDGYSAASSQKEAIEELIGADELYITNATDLARGCQSFYSFVNEDKIRHQGAQPLTSAVSSAKKRDLSDGWAWDRKDGADITQLMAVTLALQGLIVYGHEPKVEVWEPFWT